MLPCAWGAAAERARVGTLCLEDAHHLFEELLKQDNLLHVTVLEAKRFLATHASALDSSACRDTRALAVALFDRYAEKKHGRGWCLSQPIPSRITDGDVMSMSQVVPRRLLG